MDKIQLRQVLAITLSTVSLASFPRNLKVCECCFKSDIAEFEFDHAKKIKLKTFIDKMRNLNK